MQLRTRAGCGKGIEKDRFTAIDNVKFPTAGITANLWGPNKTFEVEDLVLISGHVYRCCLPHTSSPSFKDDSLMIDRQQQGPTQVGSGHLVGL